MVKTPNGVPYAGEQFKFKEYTNSECILITVHITQSSVNLTAYSNSKLLYLQRRLWNFRHGLCATHCIESIDGVREERYVLLSCRDRL